MQYLLTEQEYQGLLAKRESIAAEDAAKLQAFCTLAANHIPVARPWRKDSTPAPWGCILDKKSNPGYCDYCPAQDVCPYPGKEWSK